MTTHAEAFARIESRLADLRARAVRAPLAAPQLAQLERTATELTGMIPQLARYVAALEETRGLALEEARDLLARVRARDLETAMWAVTELRRAGHIRPAVRAYLALVRRAPRDETLADRLAGFSHLLEEYAVHPAAGMIRTLSRSLVPGWWQIPQNHEPVDETLKHLEVDWARLPP